MKLNELTGIKKYQEKAKLLKQETPIWSFHQVFTDILGPLNYKLLGQGQKGSAYDGDKYVLKIFYNDDAYLHFLKIRKAFPKNLQHYLPYIKDERKFTIENNEFYFVKLEKLYPLDYDYDEFSDSMDLIYYELIENLDPQYVINSDDYEIFVDYKEYVKIINSLPKDFSELVIFLYENKSIYSLDLHLGNFMQTKDNRLVLIDPYFDETK